MYDWDEVADASKLGTVGFNNFIVPQYSIVTAAYFKENTPSVKFTVENPENLEDASDGSCILRNNVRVQRVAEL